MNFLQKTWDKVKILCKNVWAKIDGIVNTAYPDTQKKYTFYGIMILLEILIFYCIAVLDVGIWMGDCSPAGLIAGYWIKKKWYPIGWFLLLGGLTFGGFVFYLALNSNGNTGRGFSLSKSNVYGSAREINEEELAQVADVVPKESAMGEIYGQLDLSETKLVTSKANPNSNNNVMVFGSPGSGKTFNYVINCILQSIRRGESVLCSDTKGELWAETAEFARLHGYTLRRIDLKNPEYSDGVNILSELRCDDMRALIAARTIIQNTGEEKDIHKSAEESLLRAICLYVERNRGIPEEQKTLYNAFQMLFEGAEALDIKFKEAMFDPELRVAYDAYATFVQGSANLRGNVITNLANRLQVLTSPPIRTLTSTSDVDFTLLGKKACIYYLVTSDQHETLKFIASLCFSFAFLDLVDYADSLKSRKLPVPVTMLLEEAANIGEIPNLSKYLNTCRSRRVDIKMCVQNIGQLRDIYGENLTDSILSACATHVVYGFNDRPTAEYFEWRSGTSSVHVQTEQHQHGESPLPLGRGYSTGDGRRQYYNADELMRMAPRKVYIAWQRYNCTILEAFGVNRHMASLTKERITIEPEVKIRLADKEAKNFMRKMEAERVRKYEEWISDGGDPWPDYTTPKPLFDGPARGTPIPEIVPYDKLEEKALAAGGRSRDEKKDALIREIQMEDTLDDVPDIPELEDEIQWSKCSFEDDAVSGTAYEQSRGRPERNFGEGMIKGGPWGRKNASVAAETATEDSAQQPQALILDNAGGSPLTGGLLGRPGSANKPHPDSPGKKKPTQLDGIKKISL